MLINSTTVLDGEFKSKVIQHACKQKLIDNDFNRHLIAMQLGIYR
jgi:hypothetical protein